jgi:hypothetical protein
MAARDFKRSLALLKIAVAYSSVQRCASSPPPLRSVTIVRSAGMVIAIGLLLEQTPR